MANWPCVRDRVTPDSRVHALPAAATTDTPCEKAKLAATVRLPAKEEKAAEVATSMGVDWVRVQGETGHENWQPPSHSRGASPREIVGLMVSWEPAPNSTGPSNSTRGDRSGRGNAGLSTTDPEMSTEPLAALRNGVLMNSVGTLPCSCRDP